MRALSGCFLTCVVGVVQLEAELAAQKEAEAALNCRLEATVKEREVLIASIRDSQEAAAAEARARTQIEAQLLKQVRCHVCCDCRFITCHCGNGNPFVI